MKRLAVSVFLVLLAFRFEVASNSTSGKVTCATAKNFVCKFRAE